MGERVRVSHLRRKFHRAYSQQFSGEIFTVYERWIRDGSKIYKIKDWDGDVIEGTFYEAELQGVTVSPDDTFRIDKVLKRRGRGDKREALVSWTFYPPKFNSWIPSAAIVDYMGKGDE